MKMVLFFILNGRSSLFWQNRSYCRKAFGKFKASGSDEPGVIELQSSGTVAAKIC